MSEATRGERNKNPGNVDRNATKWLGMAADQSGDKRFVIFTDPVYGIRAIGKILLSYYARYKLHTVRQIINRWAPPIENETLPYIEHVCSLLGVTADHSIDLEDDGVLELLVRSIIQHENGRCIYDDATIVRGVDMALGKA